MAHFLSIRTAAIVYMLMVLALVLVATAFIIKGDEKLKQIQILESEIKTLKAHVTEIESSNASCSATLQACIGSCVESELFDVIQEAIRIKR
jgi:Tfp pilus assembly protein PilN